MKFDVPVARLLPFLWVLVLLVGSPAAAQTLTRLTPDSPTSLRGLSVVSDQVIWASGSNGTVARSVDSGQSWKWITVSGCATCDFRDIEAFDSLQAVILKVGEPGLILRTSDGGNHWTTVYADSTPGIFLDAMAFTPEGTGYAIGDPLPGETRIYSIQTRNFGRSWERISRTELLPPEVVPGESMFASSGTNLVVAQSTNTDLTLSVHVVTGGKAASYLTQSPNKKTPLPILQGRESTGANSIALWNEKVMIVVGGDFQKDREQTGNAALSFDGGNTWVKPAEPPGGYRSCVTYITSRVMISCGTSGTDISTNGGMNWQLLHPEGYHVCGNAPNGKLVFLAGSRGRIARIQFPDHFLNMK